MVTIDSVEFGEVRINGKVYYSDIIAWWDNTFEEIEKLRVFNSDFFFRIMKKKPEIVIVAKGIEDFVKIEHEVPVLAKEKNIMFFEESMKKSLEMFHSFLKAGKKAVIIVHNM